ncbi:hypothetical protein CMO94_03070 [Candidatus Woesearchaeota archaeon]|jgi:hypothetical protein|nr:hypothetical protein [Candidatus Woesearchaeota archaeon]
MSRRNSRAQRRRIAKQQSKSFSKTRIVIAGGLIAVVLAGGALATRSYDSNEISEPDAIHSTVESENLIATQMTAYPIVDGKIVAVSITPTHSLAYGIEIPSYIILPNDFLHTENPATDDEVISVLEHERRHSIDYFKPIVYPNGVTLIPEDFSSGRVSIPFNDALDETRAYYEQLEGNLRTVLVFESKNIGSDHLGNNARQYINSIKNLQLNTKTPKENEIKDAQMDEISGIVPLNLTGDVMTFRYTLYGRDNLIKISPGNN